MRYASVTAVLLLALIAESLGALVQTNGNFPPFLASLIFLSLSLCFAPFPHLFHQIMGERRLGRTFSALSSSWEMERERLLQLMRAPGAPLHDHKNPPFSLHFSPRLSFHQRECGQY